MWVGVKLEISLIIILKIRNNLKNLDKLPQMLNQWILKINDRWCNQINTPKTSNKHQEQCVKILSYRSGLTTCWRNRNPIDALSHRTFASSIIKRDLLSSHIFHTRSQIKGYRIRGASFITSLLAAGETWKDRK